MLKRRAAALFLVGIVFLWRFQLPVGGAYLPYYVLLSPVMLAFGLSRQALAQGLTLLVAVLALTAVAGLQGLPSGGSGSAVPAAVALLVCLLATHRALQICAQAGWAPLAGAVRLFVWLQLGFQMLDLAGLSPFENRMPSHYLLPILSPTGFFAEPSHVAISYSPLIYAAVMRPGRFLGQGLGRWTWAAAGLTLALAPSASLFGVVGLATILLFASSAGTGLLAGIAVAAVSLVGAGLQFLPPEVMERADVLVSLLMTDNVNTRLNTSALVYYGGIKAATLALTDYPLGFGFMNMAAAYSTPDLTAYRQILQDRNIHDGGSTLLKLITEFGYFGLGAAMLGIVRVFRLGLRSKETVTLAAFTFPFLAFFVRGAGYFDGPILIALALLLLGVGAVATRRDARMPPPPRPTCPSTCPA